MLLEAVSAIFFFFVSSCYFVVRRLRQNLHAIVTGVDDIPYLGQALPDTEKLDGTAVICGGSLAGLLAARVCHNHFKRVVIIEPEQWLATEESRITQAWTQRHDRSRIIQYHSVQGQQAFNLTVYRALFPDFDEEAKVSGVKIAPSDSRTCIAGYFPPVPYHEYPDGLPETCYTSRQGLETLIRRLVLDSTKYPNIEYITGTATEYHSDPRSPMVLHKVTVSDSLGGGTVELDADLVLDCTGSFHTGVKMLKNAGFGFAETYAKDKLSLDDIRLSYEPKMYYSTIEVTIPPALAKRLPIPGGIDSHPSITISMSNLKKDRRTLYIIGIDGPYRMHISPGGWDIPSLPKTIEGVIEFAHSMNMDVPFPEWLFQTLDMLNEDAEVQASIAVSYLRVPPPYYYRFHRAVNLPSNWVALGDSVMRVNPVFGTGIAKTLYGTISLNNSLRTIPSSGGVIPPDFATKFFSTQKARIESFWTSVKNADYAQPTTVRIPGDDIKAGSWMGWYVRRLRMVSFEDKEASSVCWHIQNYLAPAIDAVHPRFLFKVFLHFVRNPNM